MNFSEKEQLNKIKQQKKNIQAEITKKELLMSEMRREIKERKKLYDDLNNQENKLSTTITFSSPSIGKTEEDLKEEIANKIVRDRFLKYQDTVNYSEIEKNINLQNEKSNEFQQMQKKRTSYYDVRTLVYFLPYMFLVEDDRRPSLTVTIPAKAEYCYNLLEYQAYDNMMDVINKLGYNIIPNPHVNLFDLGKIKYESYRITKSKIPSLGMLTANEIEILLPSMKIELSADHFKLHYRYEMMSNAQIQFILQIIPIDQKENVIFTVLNQGMDMMIGLKICSADNFQFVNFQFDIDTRIKLAVIYNDFRQIFPDLYGNINRNTLFFQHTILIFDTYLNDMEKMFIT
jgi:hypothetical protein